MTQGKQGRQAISSLRTSPELEMSPTRRLSVPRPPWRAMLAITTLCCSCLLGCAELAVTQSASHGCIDEAASDPSLQQMLEGQQASLTSAARKNGFPADEVDKTYRDLAPDQIRATFGPARVSELQTIIDNVPKAGYARYVAAHCAAAREWDGDHFEDTRLRWALAAEAVTTCVAVMAQPANRRDSYAAQQGSAQSNVLERVVHSETVNSRRFLCPQ
ncbi:hypothetical protein [Nocardia fluminea]|uniref:hypothetical protein n=1 Tax=Nocardia fluminea TaxID=134984 RepID=UPI003667B5F9